MDERASPEAFGAGVGQALQGLGKTGEQVGAQATDIAIRQQGMINETLATNAETQYLTQLGALSGKYKSTEGLTAAAALPQFTNDVTALRQQMRSQLPAGAAHAFDTLALRHEGYALSEANNYSAQQIKQADKQSAIDLTSVAATRAGSLDVASNDARFGETLGDIKSGVARQVQNQWDAPEVGLSQNQDGSLTFNEANPQGKQAKAVYDEAMNKATSVAWENRLHVLADQNVSNADNVYSRTVIIFPGEAQFRLDDYFTPKIRDFQARDTADNMVNAATKDYSETFPRPTMFKATGIKKALLSQESDGNPLVKASVDGAVGQYQIKPATFKHIRQTGRKH